MNPKRIKKNFLLLLTLFFSVSAVYLVWLFWKFLTDKIGNSTTIFFVVGGIVLAGIFFGFLKVNQLLKKFR